VHINPLSSLSSDEKLRSIDQHPAIKRRLWTALAEKEEGELAINVSHGWVRLDEVAYDARRAETGPREAGLEEIVIRIEYEITMAGPPGEGVVFRRPGDGGNENVRLITNRRREVRVLTRWDRLNSEYRTSSSIRPPMTRLDTGFHVWTISGTDAPGRWRSSFRDTSSWTLVIQRRTEMIAQWRRRKSAKVARAENGGGKMPARRSW
jgi:hypothetical protein